MKFGVIVFPGSNCDDDMVHVLGKVLGQEVEKIWHKETSLSGFGKDDCIILPGGFSYGDYLRAGAIARFSPVMPSVIEFANTGGLVWGVCNGFQVLCEAGLLPGALVRNEKQTFICKNVYIKKGTSNSFVSHNLSGNALSIPIAHAEGRYIADPKTLDELVTNDQVVFYYCNENGEISPEANPNGSVLNIAGVCNAQRNVVGMMPHPERASEKVLGNEDGRLIFESLLTASSIA